MIRGLCFIQQIKKYTLYIYIYTKILKIFDCSSLFILTHQAGEYTTRSWAYSHYQEHTHLISSVPPTKGVAVNAIINAK